MKRVGIFIAAILLTALVITAGWLGYSGASRPPDTGARPTPNPEVKTVPVERGDVRQVLVVPGEVVLALRRELGFPVGGRLAELSVRPGDTVIQGQTLARLETGPLEQAVALAQADLTVAEDSLDKALHPYTELDLTQARLAVAQAEVALEETRTKLEEVQSPATDLELTEARLAVDRAKTQLEEAKENLEKVQDPATEQDLTEARLAVDQAKTNLEAAKENLARVKAGPTEAELASAEAALATAQENYERLLAGPDSEAVKQAKLRLDQARNSLWNAQLSRDATCGASARGDAPKLSCDSANVQVLNAEISVQLAEISYQRAQESATTAEITNAAAQVQQATENLEELRHSPTSLEVAQAETQVTQAEYNLAKAQEALAELEAGPNPLELAQAEAQVTQAEHDLAKAQETLAEMEAGPDPLDVLRAETQVAQAEYNLAKAQETLAEIEAGPDPKEIEVAQAKVVSAQATLEKAQAELAAATLVAPFGGTVLDVKAQSGDRLNADAPIIELADLTRLEVRVTVGQEDITAVHSGQEVRLIFDVLPEETFQGRVDRVIPRKTAGQVVTYEVFIALDETPSGLLPGMTADAEIAIAERKDVLVLPRRAIRARPYTTVSVPVLEASRVVTRSVEIGLVGDLNAEILSGLQEGDRVVVER